MLLKEKTAVITGSNRGIGKACLELFAKSGANVWACFRKKDEAFEAYLQGLASENGVWIKPLAFDLSDTEAVKEAGKQIQSEKQPIHALVNNAGIIHTSLFQMTPIDKIKELFDVNFFSQMLFTQYMVKLMSRNKQGSIVFLSSSAALEGNAGRSAYAATKAALIASALSMSRELAAFNIRVNTIAPGLTDTDMMRGSTAEDALNDTLKRISMKRVGTPEEIARTALFLASDLSSYMTGQVLRVDGGM